MSIEAVVGLVGLVLLAFQAAFYFLLKLHIQAECQKLREETRK